jgi:hypothetical protein
VSRLKAAVGYSTTIVSWPSLLPMTTSLSTLLWIVSVAPVGDWWSMALAET